MWPPKEVQKIICQVAGIIFGFVGVWLIIQDVKTTGKISITSKLLSGEIESGSAGLLLAFLSFGLIVAPVTFLSRKEKEEDKKLRKIEHIKDALKAFVGFLFTGIPSVLMCYYIYYQLMIVGFLNGNLISVILEWVFLIALVVFVPTTSIQLSCMCSSLWSYFFPKEHDQVRKE